MTEYVQKVFTGERALFSSRDLSVRDCTFEDGESPLKESKNISAVGCPVDYSQLPALLFGSLMSPIFRPGK